MTTIWEGSRKLQLLQNNFIMGGLVLPPAPELGDLPFVSLQTC